MENSQITSCKNARYRANSAPMYQYANRTKISKVRVARKIIKKMRQCTTEIAFLIFLVTAIICTCVGIKAHSEERGVITEAHTVEVEERGENFSANYKKVNIEENREPQAFVDVTHRDEVMLYVDEEKVEEYHLPEEYKPTKLSGYEISATGPYERYIYILSEEDMKIIAKLVWAEARGECYKGKVAVAATVLNRYFSDNPFFSRESILHTATQKGQFASICNVTDCDLNAVPECMQAVEDACRGWDPTRETFEEGALYFYAPKGVKGYQAEIRREIKVMVIENHNFHFDFEKNG